MRRVRRVGTAPELVVRGTLRLLGVRAGHNAKSLPGSPDLADREGLRAIFVHGCFWHGHPGCDKARLPRTNRRFWLLKRRANRARDARKSRELRALGYRVLVVWECETRVVSSLRRRLRRFWPVQTRVSTPLVARCSRELSCSQSANRLPRR